MTFSPFWCLYPENPMPSPPFWPRCWSRRHGARSDRVAFLRRDAARWPQTPATAIHHPPIWQRLCRRSCNEWPVSQWGLSAPAGTSTASRCWVATRRGLTKPVSSSPPFRTGLAPLRASGSTLVVHLHDLVMKRLCPFRRSPRVHSPVFDPLSPTCMGGNPCTACAFAGYLVHRLLCFRLSTS
jgi:hypothetical protein